MTPAQGYVSRELSHFVGNTTKGQTEGEQYDVLVNKILKTGLLTYPPHDPTKCPNLNLIGCAAGTVS